MKFRFILSFRGVVFVCTGLLFAATFDARLSAEESAWNAAGTRQSYGSQLTPKSETKEAEEDEAASNDVEKTAKAVPRRIDPDLKRYAKPIRRSRRPATAQPVRQRVAAEAHADYPSRQPVRQARSGDSAVRHAVAVQHTSQPQGAHRTVSYQPRPYPTAPWHPHPYYAAYTSPGFNPGRFVSHAAAQPESIIAGEIVESPGGILDPEPAPEVWGDAELHEIDGGYYEGDVGHEGSCGCDESACGCGFSPLFASVLFGVQGYKDALDLGRNGNFGFQEGFEIGIPAPLYPIGVQFGMRFTQSNFEGDQTTDSFRDDGHDQIFLTAGLFRRFDGCCPWQYGVVFDWRHDNYWVETDMSQIRFEISRANCWGNEFGFLMSQWTGDEKFHDEDANQAGQLSSGIRPTNFYSVFWRRPTEIMGEWRFMAGVTGDSGALLGGDFWLPVGRCLALEGDWAFLLTDDGGRTGQRTDAYGVGLNLAWYPYRTPRNVADHPYRPVMPVANNSRFFSRVK
jgi:hypothetical protein